MSQKNSPSKPLVYSCSGCSNVAQLANDIAVTLDRENHAEMSCIAGVGGNVPMLVKKAKLAEHIIAIDGCHLGCVRQTLAQHNIKANQYINLSKFGFRKRMKCGYTVADSLLALKTVYQLLDIN